MLQVIVVRTSKEYHFAEKGKDVKISRRKLLQAARRRTATRQSRQARA